MVIINNYLNKKEIVFKYLNTFHIFLKLTIFTLIHLYVTTHL